MKFEYATTASSYSGSYRTTNPDGWPKVELPAGEGWELVNTAVVGTVSGGTGKGQEPMSAAAIGPIDDGTIFYTWRRPLPGLLWEQDQRRAADGPKAIDRNIRQEKAMPREVGDFVVFGQVVQQFPESCIYRPPKRGD